MTHEKQPRLSWPMQGVYTDWSDCTAQVDHHKGNSYKV